MTPKQNACVVLLAGGRGTRVRALYPNVPKPFIHCAKRPFIEWVIHYFHEQGLQQFIISLGYLAEVAEDSLRCRAANATRIAIVTEPYPMGTGGALLQVRDHLSPHDVVVCANADSLVLADLEPVWSALEDPLCDGAIVGVELDDASRYGMLAIGRHGLLLSLQEKRSGSGVVNAGVYFFKADVLRGFPRGLPLSMERDVFPHLISLGMRFFVHVTDAPFLDIGTPESIRAADQFIEENFTTTGTA